MNGEDKVGILGKKNYTESISLMRVSDKVDGMYHHTNTILFLSAINMIMNILTIAISFIIAWWY